MYEKLDEFLNVESWHSLHPYDEERFFIALDQIVREERFNADQMAEYMRDKFGISDDDDDHHFVKAIDHYRDAAWAVRTYLDANKLR